MEYDIISWEEIDESIEVLAKQIEESNIYYEVLYGLARGGLVPAVMLSHRLRIPMVLNMEEVWRLKLKFKAVLIVDDICDTGKTLQYFYTQKFDIATLFVRQHTSKIKPKYSYKNINHNNWLLFPWETKSSSK